MIHIASDSGKQPGKVRLSNQTHSLLFSNRNITCQCLLNNLAEKRMSTHLPDESSVSREDGTCVAGRVTYGAEVGLSLWSTAVSIISVGGLVSRQGVG